ncbi:hypothetical protein KKG24_05355, partial [Patescibacteria group bacterium]|nr:hypothetical protein [Patescibacteria group bacterium]
RFAKQELEPPAQKDALGKETGKIVPGKRKERVFLSDPKAGGIVWRFAEAMNQMYRSYSHKETVLKDKGEAQYLARFVMDPGVIFGWLRNAVEAGYKGSLETYLNEKLEAKLKAVSPKEDANLAREFFLHYGLLAKKKKEEPVPTFTPLTPEEIGLLSPRVKYLQSKEAGEVTTATAIIEGKIVRYKPVAPEGFTLGEIRVKPAKGKAKETNWQLLGKTEEGKLVIKRTDAAAVSGLAEKEEFMKWEERKPPSELEPPEFKEIRDREAERNKEFFGDKVKIEIPPLPKGITKEMIAKWEKEHFRLEYWPKVDMTEDKNFPGWQHKPGNKYTPNKQLGIEFYDELKSIQNLPENKNNLKLADPQTKEPYKLTELPGCWVLQDTRPKPNYVDGNQTYENDGLMKKVFAKLKDGGILDSEAGIGRNKIHPDIFNKPKFWLAMKEALGVNSIPNAVARLPRLIEQNYRGQGTGFHDKSTYEWSEEYYQSGERLFSGSSDYGGASYVNCLGYAFGNVGFRPLVVFSSEIGPLEPWDLELWEKKVEDLRVQESKKLSAFFEKTIDVPPLPAEITPDRLANWEKLGFELHYFPAEDMTKDRNLKAWKKKPNDWFYEQIASGEIPSNATQLPEGWFVVDGRQKPDYADGNQMYDNDPLASALGELNNLGIISQTKSDGKTELNPASRFGLKPTDFEKPKVIAALANALGFAPAQFSLTETISWNVLANIHHPEWGGTNTYEWQKEEFGSGKRLLSGHSDFGGASSVDWYGNADDGVGFRPLGRFSP